jgi:hypothetical protein
MKFATLNQIARQIEKETRRELPWTVHEMIDQLKLAAGGATNKREAAYLIATEVFGLIDEEDEDRRRINSILSMFDGEWKPEREEVA